MNSLRESQLKFKNGLLQGATDIVSSIAKRPLLTAENAFAIYQNNYLQNLLKTMRITFPVTIKIVGEAYFDKVASEFIRAHPSRSFDLNAYGEAFSECVGNELPYLPDVVLLEWYTQCCYLSADAGVFDFEAFNRVPDEKKNTLVFTIKQNVFILHSQFPILDIWKMNSGECETVSLDKGEQRVLVCQENYKPVLIEIDKEMYECLSQVRKGACFEVLTDHVEQLIRAIQLGWINGFKLS